jgi:hypothetical protein
MSAPRLHIIYCLCRKPIPQNSDVYALDPEWQRRYPQMVGTLACNTCAVSSTYFFRCRNRRDDAYVPGHLQPGGRGEGTASTRGITSKPTVLTPPWSTATPGQQHAKAPRSGCATSCNGHSSTRTSAPGSRTHYDVGRPPPHRRNTSLAERDVNVQDSIHPVLTGVR